MACVHPGVHDQEIDRMLGIEGVEPAPERRIVGDVDRPGHTARARAGATRRNAVKPRLVAGDEAESTPRLGILRGKSRAQAGTCACDDDYTGGDLQCWPGRTE